MVMEETCMSSWRKTSLAENTNLQQAVCSLEETAAKIVLVVSSDDRFIGTITDGDIRRGLLRGLDLSSPIDSIIHREAIVVPPNMSRQMVLQLMQANAINAVPVVDQSRKVVGVHLLGDLLRPVHRPNIMVIMAGGKGTRLRPHTENCPKPMLPVDGKPMLQHIILRAKGEGFEKFVLSVNYLGHMVEDHFGDGSRWGVKIEYLREDSPMGTVGALSLLSPQPTLPFLVTNGDVLTHVRYSELLDFHESHGAEATMAVRLHEWRHQFGVVQINGVDIVGFEEKPIFRSHINAGVYALNPSALDTLVPNEYCDMPTLFTRLQKQSVRTIAYPMYEAWLDVGRVDDYITAQDNFEGWSS